MNGNINFNQEKTSQFVISNYINTFFSFINFLFFNSTSYGYLLDVRYYYTN